MNGYTHARRTHTRKQNTHTHTQREGERETNVWIDEHTPNVAGVEDEKLKREMELPPAAALLLVALLLGPAQKDSGGGWKQGQHVR